MIKEKDNLIEGCEENQSPVLSWDSIIENDGKSLIVLEEGEYNFVVKKFERSEFSGSDKLPRCPKAILTLQVTVPDGVAIIHTDLLLCKSMEWKLAAFFRSLGMKKHGEKLVMDWSKVQDSVGHGYFRPREYYDDNGNVCLTNELVRYIDWEDKYSVMSYGSENKPIELEDDDLPF